MRRLVFFGNLLAVSGALLLVRPAAHFATGWCAQTTARPAGVLPAESRSRRAPRPAEGEALGRLEVPRIGLDLVVFEGSSDATLLKGPGHLPGTAWPSAADKAGNCVITGHRDSFFRKLEAARKNDLVRVHGPGGTSTYRLGQRRIVRPEDVSVIAPTSDARLTLITCYPFHWVGSAPYRLVWSATPVDPALLSEGPGVSQ